MRNWLNILILLGFIGFFGCIKQEGCTDSAALNYDITAKEDNGSCEYCEVDSTFFGNGVYQIIDNTFGSPHYGEQIITITANKYNFEYSNGTCGNQGCKLKLVLKNNLTAENISINTQLNFSGSFQYFQRQIDAVILKDGIYILEIDAFNKCQEDFSNTTFYAQTFVLNYN